MVKSLMRDAGPTPAQGDRGAFWVAPPRRYVINRHNPAVVPHSLSVVLVADPHMMEPTAFLQPIAPLSGGARGTPSFFRADVYVWDDTTLREILEAVLAASAAARRVLLPAAVTGEEEEDGHTEGDGASIAVDDGDGSANGGNGANTEPPSKRERREEEKEVREETVRNNPPQHPQGAQRRSRRPPSMPVSKVRVSHVFAGNDKKPRIRDITVLRVDKPVFHAGDHTTMQELRTSRVGDRVWKNGDLLVLSPAVRHYKV